MREHRFEIIEHTADVGVIGFGSDMAGAFESAAFGMFSIMTDLSKHKPTRSEVVYASGDEDVVLLQGFLSSLIVLFETKNVLPLDFEITEISMGRLTCWVSVRPIDDSIEWTGPAIKAVTFHQMAVESDGEWRARVIFDV